MNNVQCAGGGWWLKPEGKTVVKYSRERGDLGVDLPCGWKGERVADFRAAELSEPRYRHAATADPCPHCGGRVELIPTRGAP